MEAKLLERARQILRGSHFESLLSLFRPRSFASRFQWFGGHWRERSEESDPGIRSEADHLARSRRGQWPAIELAEEPARRLSHPGLQADAGQLAITGVAVEKVLRTKLERIKLRSDAPQATFSIF